MSEKKRFVVAVGGVAFGVILMLFQLGIYQAFMRMVARPIDGLKGELAMISRNFNYIMSTESFPERRLYQTLALPEVQNVYPLLIHFASWRSPATGINCETALYGVQAFANPFILPEVVANEHVLSMPDGALFDAMAPAEFGDITGMLQRDGVIRGEINSRHVRVLGTFQRGGTLAVNCHVIVGMETFRRVTGYNRHSVDVGMIKLRPGADAAETAKKLNALLPKDIDVLTRDEFIRKEQYYWQINTPIGFIVTAGMVIAMFVGSVIAYQTLYTDINDHIREYATLKALGLGSSFFLRLILQEAIILPAFGFVPGVLCAWLLFQLADKLGGLPTRLTVADTLTVFCLTIAACIAAGFLATRRLRAADPADIF